MADNNTIYGWVLAAGITALGLSILSEKYFEPGEGEHGEEKQGYVIQGVERAEEGGGDEVNFTALLAQADAAAGEKAFAKCTACHSIAKGGANGIGPNLYGIVGKPHASVAGFDYSSALKGTSGPWSFDALNEWLTNPAGYAAGTKMTFAGIKKPEERANVIAYLNSMSDSPQPLPDMPAEEAAPAAEAADAPAEGEAGADAPAEGETAAAPAES